MTDAKDKDLKVAGLFACIGGIERGLHEAGHKTVLLCEARMGNDDGGADR
jgi:site-specific DNA-cytosine methylase